MASGKWRPNIWYRKKNVTSFIFRKKNVEASWDSLYQLKLFLFDRDSYFWKKRAVMLACNLILKLLWICALICRNLLPLKIPDNAPETLEKRS